MSTLTLEKVYVSKKGSSLGKSPAVLLGNKDTGILIRQCKKVGCPIPVGVTRACDMEVFQTAAFVNVEPTQEESAALAELSVRLGSYEKFYEIAIPTGVDPLFVRYRDYFPGLLRMS